MKKIVAGATLARAVCTPVVSAAAVIITGAETGAGVMFTYTGNINLTGLGTPTLSGNANRNSLLIPAEGGLLMGNGAAMDFWLGPYTFSPFGSGGYSYPNSVTGPGFSIYTNGFG